MYRQAWPTQCSNIKSPVLDRQMLHQL